MSVAETASSNGLRPILWRCCLTFILGFVAVGISRRAPKVAAPPRESAPIPLIPPTAPPPAKPTFPERLELLALTGDLSEMASQVKLWLEEDSTAALAWLRSLPPTLRREHLLAMVAEFGSYDESLHPWSPVVLECMHRSKLRALQEFAYLKKLAATDFAGAVNYANTRMAGSAKIEAMHIIAEIHAVRDPQAAWDLLKSGYLVYLNATSVRNSQSSGTGSSPSLFLLIKLGRVYPREVVETMLQVPNLLRRDNLWSEDLSEIPGLSEWMKQQPAEAVAWFCAQAKTPATPGLTKHVITDLSQLDVPLAQAFLDSLPADKIRDDACERFVENVSATHLAFLLPWFQSQLNSRFLRAVISKILQNAPEDVIVPFTQLSTQNQLAYVGGILDVLSARSPDLMRRFFDSLKPPLATTIDLADGAFRYGLRDFPEACCWVHSIPVSRAKDTAIQGLIRCLVATWVEAELPAAAELALHIRTAEIATACLKDIAEMWQRLNPAARMAITQSVLPSTVRKQLLRYVPAPP